CDVVGGDPVSGRRPGNGVAGALEHPGDVGERVAVLQPGIFGDAAVGERDVRVLHYPQRDLALDLGRGVAGVVLLHDERLDLSVLRVTGEDDDHVAPHGVAGPALTTVDHPLAAVPLGRGLKDDRVGPVI